MVMNFFFFFALCCGNCLDTAGEALAMVIVVVEPPWLITLLFPLTPRCSSIVETLLSADEPKEGKSISELISKDEPSFSSFSISVWETATAAPSLLFLRRLKGYPCRKGHVMPLRQDPSSQNLQVMEARS